jgi:hypothetical protein
MMQLPRVDREYSNLSKLPPYIFLFSVGEEEELKNLLYIAAADLDEVRKRIFSKEYNFRFIDMLYMKCPL